jgi:anti-sigma factor (TIGR02949 family)
MTETTEEMACRELVERVTEYLDAALDDGDRRRFEAHVGECPGCLEILDQFRAVVTTTGALRPADAAAVDPDARARLLDRFRTWSDARD